MENLKIHHIHLKLIKKVDHNCNQISQVYLEILQVLIIRKRIFSMLNSQMFLEMKKKI
jgi:hypothetical protein